MKLTDAQRSVLAGTAPGDVRLLEEARELIDRLFRDVIETIQTGEYAQAYMLFQELAEQLSRLALGTEAYGRYYRAVLTNPETKPLTAEETDLVAKISGEGDDKKGLN